MNDPLLYTDPTGMASCDELYAESASSIPKRRRPHSGRWLKDAFTINSKRRTPKFVDVQGARSAQATTGPSINRELDLPEGIFRRGAPVQIWGDELFIGHEDMVYRLEVRTGETVATYRVPGSARRFVTCEEGVVVAAGELWIGPRTQTVALRVQ